MFIRTALLLPVMSIVLGAQSIPIPIITSATTNAAVTEVTLEGAGFGSARPSVKLVKTPLAVITYTPTTIVAQLPTAVLPGSYVLTVTNEETHFSGIFVAALQSAGPAVSNNAAVFVSNVAEPTGPQYATYYQSVASTVSNSPVDVNIPVPSACTVDSFIFQLAAKTTPADAANAVNGARATVLKNGVATTINCSIAPFGYPTTTGNCSDTNHTAAFAFGDEIAVEITQGGSQIPTRSITSIRCR